MAKPAKCISVEEARKLQDNWVSTRAKDIENAQGEEDQREIIYSVEELQEFLDYVKEESTAQGVSNPGIRIYFAAYDNADSDKATVFLAPTKGSAVTSDNNYNIEPFNFGSGGWPPYKY